MSRLAFHRPARFLPPPPDEKAVLPAPPGAQSRAAATTWMSMLVPFRERCGAAAGPVREGAGHRRAGRGAPVMRRWRGRRLGWCHRGWRRMC